MRTTPTTTVNPNDAVCNIFRVGISGNQSTISSVQNNYMNASGGVLIVNVSSTSSGPIAGDLAAYDPDGDSHCIFLNAEF